MNLFTQFISLCLNIGVKVVSHSNIHIFED